MSDDNTNQNSQLPGNDPAYQSYLDFVEERARKTTFHAEAKLREMEELSEMISLARKSYNIRKET